jgi:hypothetical protein
MTTTKLGDKEWKKMKDNEQEWNEENEQEQLRAYLYFQKEENETRL